MEQVLFHENTLSLIVQYLGWEDILGLLKTCKRMNQVTKNIWNTVVSTIISQYVQGVDEDTTTRESAETVTFDQDGHIKLGNFSALMDIFSNNPAKVSKNIQEFTQCISIFVTPDEFLREVLFRLKYKQATISATWNEAVGILNILSSVLQWNSLQFTEKHLIILKLTAVMLSTTYPNQPLISQVKQHLSKCTVDVPYQPEANTTEPNNNNNNSNQDTTPFEWITKYDAELIALVITQEQAKLWSKLKVHEFTSGMSWAKADRYEKTPNLVRIIQRWNIFHANIGYLICTRPDLSSANKVMKQLAKIGKALLDLRNYDCLMMLYAAINNSAVGRLKIEVKSKYQKYLDEMKQICTTDRSYANLRTAMRDAMNSSAPYIPYLGLTLTDLTFIMDGNAACVSNQQNFSRARLVHKSICDIFQNSNHMNFTVPPKFNKPKYLAQIEEIRNHLAASLKSPKASDNELYSFSLKLRPRGN